MVDKKQYGCKIIIHQSEGKSPDNKTLKYFSGLSFEQYIKWRWYFRYLTAKYQTENPRKFIEWDEFSYKHVDPDKVELKRLKGRITSAKAKITQYENQLRKVVSEWNELFPITENDKYKRTVEYIESKKKLLAEMQEEFNQKQTP